MEISKFCYCPLCGAQDPVIEESKLFCNVCQGTLYKSSGAAVGVVFFFSDGRIVMSKRKIDPFSGKYDFIGGFVDAGESAEETAVREVKEELCIDIYSEKLSYMATFPGLYPCKDITYDILDIFYTYSISTELFSKMKPTDEIDSIIAVDPHEVTHPMCSVQRNYDIVQLMKK